MCADVDLEAVVTFGANTTVVEVGLYKLSFPKELLTAFIRVYVVLAILNYPLHLNWE